jgi:hypothetical protein
MTATVRVQWSPDTAPVEIRLVTGRQLMALGVPAGPTFPTTQFRSPSLVTSP